jgi:hypothetical protein
MIGVVADGSRPPQTLAQTARMDAHGVPAGLALEREMLVGLKSGSFGDADFLLTAAAHLCGLGVKGWKIA